MTITFDVSKIATVKILTRCVFILIAFHISLATANVELFGLPITQIDIQGNKKRSLVSYLNGQKYLLVTYSIRKNLTGLDKIF